MVGARDTHRHLSRSSAHRQALLRNLVTSLFEHETITTTWHKAKEAQALADKLVTMAKKNTIASRSRAQSIFYKPDLLTKLFGPIRERYLERPGGYTRVLRIEPEKEDQAESAILELVDSPKDIRFAMTAKVVARQRAEGLPETPLTRQNLAKVMRYRGDEGKQDFEDMVGRFKKLTAGGKEVKEVVKKKVYPDPLEPRKGKKGPKWRLG
ncbi:mitochondrial 54S ribosomal protein bL17m [Phyllosticta citribraziliensis]|uniref:Ribosomal protein L17 n=1 Tax=Phyllosticta citribraziliensis TaxID=989973 RepID=A0ABR1LAT1_9PEZI